MSGGIDTISYMLTTGCEISETFTVDPAPPVITGAAFVCAGGTTTLTDALGGGTWTSGSTTIATVVPGTGVVHGVSAGLVTITYTGPSGCSITTDIEVFAPPSPITGTLHVCMGQTTILGDISSGGTWTSSNTGVATVTPGPGIGGGIVSGVTAGTTTISYTIGTGCSSTAIVTVNAAPPPVTGSHTLCQGSTEPLSDTSVGGTWTSSSPGVASVSLTGGLLTAGTSTGTATITYSLGGTCVSTFVVTVMPLPTPCTVSGGGAYCAGGAGVSITLGCSTIGVTYMLFTGGAPAGAPVAGTGGAITFGPETVAGTYTVVATIAATGCSRAMTGSATVTINPLPTIYAVTGGGIYCAGGAGVHIGLSGSDPGVTYHVYRGVTTLVATLLGAGGPLDFGLFTTAGAYTITATSAAGCTSSMSGSATVGIDPAPPACPVTGGGSYCAGGTGVVIGLGCSTVGVSYQLFMGTTAVGLPVSGTGGAITFGTFTAAGTYTAVATSSTTGCSSPMTGSATITISPLPTITGGTAVCVGSSIPLSATPGGGTWSSSNTSDVTVSSTGVATGVTTSTCATITYTSPAGCVSTTTVCVSPSPSTITGPASVCVGSCIGLTDVVGGGTWTSSGTTIATAGLTSGTICGVVPGTVTITYSLGSGCTKTTVIAVTPAPSAIGGPSSMCNGTCVTETDLVGGGSWSSGNTAVATIGSTGTMCGVGTGTATITYTVGGCIATKTITVNFAPTPLGGPGSVCSGAMIGLIEGVGGGTWTSSNTLRATVDGTGTVTGGIVTAAVTDTISYSLGGSCVVEKIITVDPISAISGPTGVCVGYTSTLSGGSGGCTW